MPTVVALGFGVPGASLTETRRVRVCFHRGMAGADAIFDELAGGLDYAMLVVTAASEGEADGCLVGFATQCSISPPRFIVCLSERNRTYRIASRAECLGVHVLGPADEDLAELFGGETADDTEKLGRVAWRAGPGGAPLIDRCSNRFVGRVRERTGVGDHVAFLLDPIHAEHDEAVEVLPFQRVKRIDPGHEA